MKKLLLTLTAAATASIAQAQTVIDFNTPGEFASDFAGFSNFSQAATGGLSDSGSVTLTTSSQIAVYQTGVDITGVDNGSFGMYFQYNGASDSGRPFSIGFTSGASDTYSNSATTTGTDLRLVLGGAGSGDNYGLQLLNNGGAFATSLQNVTLVDGDWYYIQLNVGGISGGDFTGVSGDLFASDDAGNLGAALKILDNSGTGGYTTTSSLTSDADVYVFFGGQNPSTRGAAVADNLTFVVPEPTSAALLIGASGLLLLRRRR